MGVGPSKCVNNQICAYKFEKNLCADTYIYIMCPCYIGNSPKSRESQSITYQADDIVTTFSINGIVPCSYAIVGLQ